MPITEGILAELNRLTRMCFKSQHPNGELTANGRLVLALLKKGYQADQLTRVVRLKCRAWLGGDMQKFLRPKTLFAPANFDQYVAGLAEPPAVQFNQGGDDEHATERGHGQRHDHWIYRGDRL
jgi:uncharacterized phage protein (TIGR02220 family)